MEIPELTKAAAQFPKPSSYGTPEGWALERLVFDKDSMLTPAQMYEDYCAWCASRNWGAWSKRALGAVLVRHGVKMKRTAKQRYYLGIRLKE